MYTDAPPANNLCFETDPCFRDEVPRVRTVSSEAAGKVPVTNTDKEVEATKVGEKQAEVPKVNSITAEFASEIPVAKVDNKRNEASKVGEKQEGMQVKVTENGTATKKRSREEKGADDEKAVKKIDVGKTGAGGSGETVMAEPVGETNAP